MKLVVCLDDHNGLLFNKRRLSCDAAVVKDIVQLAAGFKVIIEPYSLKLFSDYLDSVIISQDISKEANSDNYYFAERADMDVLMDQVDCVIIYRWNRVYPSDVKFSLESYSCNWKRKSVTEFVGNSHKCITREVYCL